MHRISMQALQLIKNMDLFSQSILLMLWLQFLPVRFETTRNTLEGRRSVLKV